MKVITCIVQDIIHKNKNDMNVVVRKDELTLYSCSLVPLKFKSGQEIPIVLDSDDAIHVKWYDPKRVAKEIKEAKQRRLRALQQARNNKNEEKEMKKVASTKKAVKKVTKKTVAKKAVKKATSKKSKKKSCK